MNTPTRPTREDVEALCRALRKRQRWEESEPNVGLSLLADAIAMLRRLVPPMEPVPRGVVEITNDSRTAFEQLQRSGPGFVSFDLSVSNGRYLDDTINDQWQAWQAA